MIFLWVTTRAIEIGMEILDQNGYTLVNEIIWVKLNQFGRLIRTGKTGHWINHSKEHCLVGVKGRKPHMQIDSKPFNVSVDQDVIVSEVRETSRKPDELHGMIDRILGPRKDNAKKLEIFARENNLRSGFLSIGNQLPESHITDPKLLQRLKMM